MSFVGDLIQKHEGRRLYVYCDTKGLRTIGIGFNLDAPGAPALCARMGIDYAAVCGGVALTPTQMDAVFQYQLTEVLCQAAMIFPTWATLPQNVQAVIADMLFNMGEAKFLGFVRAIAAIKAGQWQYAADEIEDSEWAKEVPTRAKDDAVLLRSA